MMNDNNIKDINFNRIKYQEYYVYYLINKNKDIDNPTIKKEFYSLTNIKLELSLSSISKIRSKIVNNFEGLSLEQLVDKINIDNVKIEKYVIDIKYNYKIKTNTTVDRIQKLIIFGTNENLKKLSNTYTKEFFLDYTFKIVPKKFRPYKLMVISGIPLESNKPELLAFILIKYTDHIAYDKLFNYLKYI